MGVFGKWASKSVATWKRLGSSISTKTDNNSVVDKSLNCVLRRQQQQQRLTVYPPRGGGGGGAGKLKARPRRRTEPGRRWPHHPPPPPPPEGPLISFHPISAKVVDGIVAVQAGPRPAIVLHYALFHWLPPSPGPPSTTLLYRIADGTVTCQTPPPPPLRSSCPPERPHAPPCHQSPRRGDILGTSAGVEPAQQSSASEQCPLPTHPPPPNAASESRGLIDEAHAA
ncbi:hypothetical protein CRUP_028986 [Coryphaenoides rupestris]|nr:hypothetical protein CRUP_028986 [Coryphaenoides rupestris]